VSDIVGGWAAFTVSMLIIGLLTAVIGDVAAHFGCTVGLKDSVTALSFVALGTSIPGRQQCVWHDLLAAFDVGDWVVAIWSVDGCALIRDGPRMHHLALYIPLCPQKRPPVYFLNSSVKN